MPSSGCLASVPPHPKMVRSSGRKRLSILTRRCRCCGARCGRPCGPVVRSRHVFRVVKEHRDPLGDRCLADGKNNNCRHLRPQQLRSPVLVPTKKAHTARSVAPQSHFTSNPRVWPTRTLELPSTVRAACKDPGRSTSFAKTAETSVVLRGLSILGRGSASLGASGRDHYGPLEPVKMAQVEAGP